MGERRLGRLRKGIDHAISIVHDVQRTRGVGLEVVPFKADGIARADGGIGYHAETAQRNLPDKDIEGKCPAATARSRFLHRVGTGCEPDEVMLRICPSSATDVRRLTVAPVNIERGPGKGAAGIGEIKVVGIGTKAAHAESEHPAVGAGDRVCAGEADRRQGVHGHRHRIRRCIPIVIGHGERIGLRTGGRTYRMLHVRIVQPGGGRPTVLVRPLTARSRRAGAQCCRAARADDHVRTRLCDQRLSTSILLHENAQQAE